MAGTRHCRTYVPLCLEPLADNCWEEYAEALTKMGAERVFLSAPALRNNGNFNADKFEELAAKLADRMEFFRPYGIKVGYWMAPTLGWGVLSRGGKSPYQQLVGPDGKVAEGIFCPLDKGFEEYFCSTMQIIAKSGVDLIMLEDDYRLHLREPDVPFGCFCPLHLEKFRQRSGLELTREEIVRQVLYGKPNKVRELWLKTIGQSLMDLAGSAEKAVHQVNPLARIGVTAVMSHWSNEGIEMSALLKKFAGNTRPFMRTIGAPYWRQDPPHVGWIVEYTRLQAHWLGDLDVELVAEGDTYPHTRFHSPAATLHAFRQGLLASGITGMLHYGIPFAPPPSHEPGYVNKTAASLKHYEAICEFFPESYRDDGVTAVETQNNFKNITMPEDTSPAMMSWPDEPASLHHLSRLGIPVAYDRADGPVILAGYGACGFSDARIKQLLDRGAVVDAVAAGWLSERGFDVGIESLTPQEPPRFERYEDPEICGSYAGQYVWLITPGAGIFYKYELRPGARLITAITDSDKNMLYPGVVHYENAQGQRICLLAFDLYKSRYSELNQIMLNYARQEQLARSLAWAGREPLRVTVNAQPNVHVISRVSPEGDRLAVAVQNANLDAVENVTLRLDRRIPVGDEIELLLPGAEDAVISRDFQYEQDGEYGNLTIRQVIPPMEMLSIGIALK